MNRVRKVKPRATDIEFEAIWLHGSYARSIGREFFYCHDLSEAVHKSRPFRATDLFKSSVQALP